MRVKYDLERQTFSQFVRKSEYPSPKRLKMQQNNKDDDKWQWRPLTAVCGHSCNFHITQKETNSDAAAKQDTEVSRFTQSRDVQDSDQGEMRRHLTFCWQKYSKEMEVLDK